MRVDVSEIFENLNEPQRNSVTSESKNLLVLAGAGSGKTRVIAHRVAWLIKAKNVNPHSILTVTFTNKASREMRGRIEGIVQEEMGNFWCGTFHGISHRLLRTHWEEAGLRKEFSILDSEDQYRVIKRVVKSMGLDDTKWPPRQIQWFINKQKDECKRSKDVDTSDDYFAEKMTEIYKTYEELCERESLVDFGELLLRVYLLLKTNQEVLAHYQRRFSYILVDEIGGLARQLQSSGIKIKSLLSKQKDFLRDVSHEVRTPLARLQISAENLELDTNDKQALNQIKKEVQIIDKLVQDLLHLSYFDQPSKSHKIESIQLIDLVDHFVQRSQILASHKNISVTLKSIKQQNLSVAGVHFLLDRALDNLMSNAIRHSSQYSEIRVSCEIDKEYCYVGITDQGEGVSEERLEEIFEPFVRLDSSRNRSTGGFGLGLSLVKRIAVMHNGSVIASNIFNESSTQTEGFVVKLILPLENKIEALKG